MADDLGLSLPYALQGLQQVLAQRKAERIAAQQHAEQLRQRQFENQLQLRNESRLEDAMKGQQEDRAAARQEQDFTRAGQINQATPDQAFLSKNDVGAQLMQKAGYGGFLRSAPAIDAQGSAFEGPTPQGSSINDYQQGRDEGYIHTATAQQLAEQAKEKAAEQRAQSDQNYRNDTLAETKRYHTGMLNKPAAGGVVAVQTTDKDGNPVTQFVNKVAGASYGKPPSATEQTRLDSAHAVIQTGDDMVKHLSDPAYAAKVGPVMGRFNTLSDFIGNPPPEFAELAGQIESYSLANMGVHGMRSAEGAKAIAALLDQHHTPESLIKTITGLSGFARHFTENKGQKTPGTTNTTTKPSAADLIKKYGG